MQPYHCSTMFAQLPPQPGQVGRCATVPPPLQLSCQITNNPQKYLKNLVQMATSVFLQRPLSVGLQVLERK